MALYRGGGAQGSCQGMRRGLRLPMQLMGKRCYTRESPKSIPLLQRQESPTSWGLRRMETIPLQEAGVARAQSQLPGQRAWSSIHHPRAYN